MARMLRETLASLLMAVVLFVIIDSITARSHVEGPSMQPTLHYGQMLLTSRLGISGFSRQAYASTHAGDSPDAQGWLPPRGAIVTLVHPTDPDTLLVKRVIGLPGEDLTIARGIVYIDNQPLNEPYVVYPDTASYPRVRIPTDAIFVMGDNRPESGDSRAFGPVPRANLLGVVVLRYWPFNEFKLMQPAP